MLQVVTSQEPEISSTPGSRTVCYIALEVVVKFPKNVIL